MKITLKEAIYGGLATLFHRGKVNNKTAFKVTIGSARTGVAIFGGGFYTTYELQDQLTDRMVKNYGEYIFKIAARVDNFFILDKAKRDASKHPLTEQQKNAISRIEEIVKDDDDFNKWEDDGFLIYVINKYSEVDSLIRKNFDGIIYQSKDDGRCAIIFNPSKSYTKVISVAHVPDWNVDGKTIKWEKFHQ